MLQFQNDFFDPALKIADIKHNMRKYIDSLLDQLKISKASVKSPDQERARSEADEYKIVFLMHFKDNVIVNQEFNVKRFKVLLKKYISENNLIGLRILETALISFHIFQEVFEEDDKITEVFEQFQLEDILFLKAVLNSSLISDYVNEINSLMNNKNSLYMRKIDCLNYFKQKIIIRITSEAPQILGCVLYSGQLVIWNTYSYNPRIEILILIHLYFQQLLGHEGLVYQHSQRNNIIDFESEIFNLKFNQEWLTQSRQDFLTNENNWLLDTQSFTKQLYSQVSGQIVQAVNPIVKLVLHNPLLSLIIGQIKDILNDLVHLQYDKLWIKYPKRPIKKQNFIAEYSNFQYYLCLKDAMIGAINNKERLHCLQQYHFPNHLKLYEIFTFLINCTNFNKISLVQQLFLWVFQYEFDATVQQCGNICFTLMKRDSESVFLDQEDQVLIQQIVESEGVKKVVFDINRIAGRISEVDDLQKEYLILKDFIQKMPIITFQVDSLFGLSLINGRVALNDILLSKDPQTRAMRIITLIHEIYCHKKRKDFVCPNCVLELTPDKMNAKQNLHKKQRFGESGYYFEDQVFGKIINQVSVSQALYILDYKNWLQNPKQFKRGFLDVSIFGYLQTLKDLKEKKKPPMQIEIQQGKQKLHWLFIGKWSKCVSGMEN